jgi:hypothetical protein
MDSLYFNYSCNISKVFFDSFYEFSNGYSDAADLIVSTIFAQCGLYDIVKQITLDEDVIKYADVRFNLQSAYIWSDIKEVSDMLRCSYLYKTTHNSLSHLRSINDSALNKITKQFKKKLIEYIQNHSMFLAYCDIEKSGLFLYTNPEQALHKERFLDLYKKALNDINIIYKRYRGKIPKVILGSISKLRDIIDVRELYEETLIIPPNKKMLLKCLPSFDKDIFNEIMFNFEKCNLVKLHEYLEILYSNVSLLHVIASLDWLVLTQGSTNCRNCYTSLQEFISIERLEYLKFIENTICSENSGVMKQELTKLNFLKKSFRILKNNKLLNYYSLDSLGYNSLFVIGNATRLYNNNIKLITFADLLFIGFYDVVESCYLPSHEYINNIIVVAEKDLRDFQRNTSTDFILNNIARGATHTFCQSLKKVKRFHRWLKNAQCDNLNEQQEGLNLIFGDVYDNDGQPAICPICLDSSIERKDTWWKIQPCSHVIHLDCYSELCKKEHCICPMCRVKIT